jgi:hypothetical protein
MVLGFVQGAVAEGDDKNDTRKELGDTGDG